MKKIKRSGWIRKEGGWYQYPADINQPVLGEINREDDRWYLYLVHGEGRGAVLHRICKTLDEAKREARKVGLS